MVTRRTYSTELDARYSDDTAAPISWERTRAILETAQVSWLSTVRQDGRAHVTPLVAAWLDDTAYFSTGRDEQKAINLRCNGHVVLTAGANHWEAGIDVTIEGTAERVTDQSTLHRLVNSWAAKWDGSWQHTVTDGGFRSGRGGLDHVFGIRIAKILAFGRGPNGFSHTVHVPSGGPE